MTNERGYAMAALLVALAVMAILMSVAMPVWRQQARREMEAELVFRGEQYARAIALYNFKNNQVGGRGLSLPPSIDVLVQGRYLRKKYKDPMTKDGEFLLIAAGQPAPGGPTPPGTSPPGARGGQPPSIGVSGISGVRSKSEENSLRSYRGQTRYDQWQFTFNTVRRPGGVMPPANTGDGRGGTGMTPPGPGGAGGRRGSTPFGGTGTPAGGTGPRIGPGTGGPGGAPPGGGRRGSVPGGGRGPGE